jgi:hypothetical protein
LARLTKAREVQAQKRAAKAAAAAASPAPAAQAAQAPKLRKTKSAPPPSEESSTDSSDTSDSEVEEQYKRRKQPKELPRKDAALKEKYKARYETRYRIMKAIMQGNQLPTVESQRPEPARPAEIPIKQAVRAAAQENLQASLHRELVANTMKNIFG